MANPDQGKHDQLVLIKRLPWAVLQAFGLLFVSALWMKAFDWFWTFMVIELPKDLGPLSQMSALSNFMHKAFPMKETNDVRFEYNFDHVLIMALVLAAMMMSWPFSRREVLERAKKQAKSSRKKERRS
mmetsp:Transcript_94355/g.149210  ORF Transcript_94355/g.149210 Transcript_94355/m.149210 type:complete len:128 (+) Transcript_94355:40-423(+)